MSRIAGRGGIALALVASASAVVTAAAHPTDAFMVLMAAATVALLAVPVVGAAAVVSSPQNLVGWILLAAGSALPLAIAAYLYGRAVFEHGADLPAPRLAGWLEGWPWVPAVLLVPTIGILLFPDGRLPSSRWRVLLVLEVLLAVVLTAATLFATGLLDWPDVDNPTGLPGAAGEVATGLGTTIVLVAPFSTLSAVALRSRLRRATDPRTRDVLRGVQPAVWLIVASWWGCLAMGMAGGGTINALPVEAVGMLALGVGCWVAVRRHGLFDARIVIRRGLVYGALTLCVSGVYAVVALLLGQLGAGHLATPVAVALGITVAVPLRDRLQRGANRLVFGLRDDPVATIARLGEQLENAAAADDVLPAAAQSVREALRLQHVQIRLGEAPEDEVLAEAGSPGGLPPEDVPLVYTGERVGTLTVEPTPGDAPLGAAVRELLVGIARPVAAAARATALSRDLAASRERMVAATEEERRRLRRDLHDGLGPTLGSAVLGITRAQDLVVRDPDAAVRQLQHLTSVVQDAVAEVRRLVYGLRPPALDELGLIGALDEQGRNLGPIRVHGPSEPMALGAAVEVAAYRIAMEAMTNAVRHAHPSAITVEVSVDGCLHLEVVDDGVGLPEGYCAGVGITSMRERAAELGGLCTVERGHPNGTVVRTVVPLEAV